VNSQEAILSFSGDLTSNYAIAYLMADELYNAIEFGNLTTQGTISSNFIVVASTFISTFVIESYGPITITFNPAEVNLPKKINRIVYTFDDGSPTITHSFYYSLTSPETANYPFPLEPGDPRNFKVTKTFGTNRFFRKTFNVYADVYQVGVYDPYRVLYIININAPEMDGENANGTVFLEEMHLVSTRMFGANDDILYIFETKNPNYIIPFILNWEKKPKSSVFTNNIEVKSKRPYRMLQPWEIENINSNGYIKIITEVKSQNSISDGGGYFTYVALNSSLSALP
jgi:hypothetical protein